MAVWVGSDDMRVVRLLPYVRRQLPQVASAAGSMDEPSPMSVHAVKDGAEQTLCGAYHARRLTRLAPPWEE